MADATGATMQVLTHGTTPTFAPKPPLEELLFDSSTVGIGTFRCRPDHPLFRYSGPSSTYCFVFPRTSVWIQHAGERPFVADPRVVTYYNAGQVYSRRAVSPDGDRGEWFAMAPDVADEIVSAIVPTGRGRGRRVFEFSHGPSDRRACLAQRRIIEQVRAPDGGDPIEIEERVVALLADLVALAAPVRDRLSTPSGRKQADLVEAARAVLARTATRPVRLADIAAELSCSVFHLCRTFRRVQGTTLHAYRHDLRLRMALEPLAAARGDLTRIALDLGFSSHSHFTAAFRRHFGLTPSAFAAELRSGSSTRPLPRRART